MSRLTAVLLDELTEDELDVLAARLGPRLTLAPAPGPWLSPDEAADRMRCKRQRIYDLVHAGHLEPARDGTRLLLHVDHIDAYLTTQQEDPA